MNLKNIKLYIKCFIIPIIIILLAVIVLNKPIENFILRSDVGSQYVGFFSKFQNILKGKDSILYSFNSGLGSNFLSDFYYYLASPFNLLLVLFSKSKLLIGIFLIVILKCGFSSVSMSIYLKSKFKISNFNILLLSVCYSLSGYFASFFINPMWFDTIIIMPLVLYGIDDIINNNSIKKYVFFFSLLIFVNYYLAYMCFLFCVMYFLYTLLLQNESYKKKIILFIKANLLSILIMSFVLIPSVFNIIYLKGNRGLDYVKLNTILDRVKIIINTFLQLFPYSSTSFNTSKIYIPNIYCGLFVSFQVLFYFINNKISKKEKKLSAIFISIFLVCFFTNIGNFIFSGFSYPFGYHFRYSFLLIILFIILSARNLEETRENLLSKITLKKIIYINLFCIIIFVLSLLFNDLYSIYNLIFLIIIFNIYNLIFLNVEKYKYNYLKLIISFIVLSELFLNFYNSLYLLSNQKNYSKKFKEISEICESSIQENRYIYDYRYYRNLPLFCGTLGAEYSSSNINYGIKNFYYRVGSFVSGSGYNYTESNTKIMKELLNIDSNSLSIGYMVNSNIHLNSSNPFKNQNSLLSAMLGESVSPLKEIKKTQTNKKNEVQIDYNSGENDSVYFYFYHNFKDILALRKFVEIRINNKKEIIVRKGNNRYSVIKINSKRKNNKIVLKKQRTDKEYNKFNYLYNINRNWLYYEDEKITSYAISKLSKNKLKIIEMKKNIIKGKVSVDKNKILFLTIPYEEGWNIYVDGKKTDYIKLYDAFIGIKLEEGNHEIKMKFYPKGLFCGLFISISTILYILFKKIIINYKRKSIP